MPIYEFECENCGHRFESLQKRDEEFPPCPECGSKDVIKVPSIFGFQDRISYRETRERAIMKRLRDYLIDGKIKDAQKFMEKARNLQPTDRVKKIADKLSEARPPKGAFVVKPEAVIKKKK